MRVFTIATRGGKLARAQTEFVADALQRIYPDIRLEIRKVTTQGDRDRRTALWDLRTGGFFTSQVEDVLLASDADLAVHSFKDLPTRPREGLAVAAVCDRQFAEDCLVAREPVSSIEQLPALARIGTSSLRRAVQLKRLRADLQPTPIRGNVRTRLRKLDKGEFDAIVLARAGLERLGLAENISISFDPTQFIPAPAQGALAVQTRSDDLRTKKLVAAIDDMKIRTITCAERQVLVTMRCGCRAPVGAFAHTVGDNIEIHAFIADPQSETFIGRQVNGPASRADELAEEITTELLKAGGREILKKLEKVKGADDS